MKNVAAFVCGMDEEYPYHIIRGINKYAAEHDINVSYFASFGGIVDSEEFDAGEYSIYNLPDFSGFDGAILLTNTFSNPTVRNSIIDRVKAAGLPSVIFESKEHKEFHDVSINNYSVMKKLVEHLIHVHGARVFNYVSGPKGNPEAAERYRAFRDVLSENGIDFDEENRLYHGFFRSYDGIRAVETFVKTGLPMPDAFVCANDSMAITAMSALQEMCWRVPEDVIVTGFDNTFNARNACPALTSVSRPIYDSGVIACSTLYSLMNGEILPRSIELEAEPVYSESCGCCEDSTGSMMEFKKEVALRVKRSRRSIHLLNRMMARLAGAETIDDCVEPIEDMMRTIGCDDFALCLVENWENTYDTMVPGSEEVSYPPVMTAPIIWDHGEIRKVKGFPSKQLFPEPRTTGGNISYFIPLHFSERVLGYYIMSNTDFPINSDLCHTITMSIADSLELISKLNVLDPLCGIYNLNGFKHYANFLLKDCVATKTPITVAFLDMDGLKDINDTYGHMEGDTALKCVGDCLEAACGEMDICGRIGGDEFLVIGRGEGFADRFVRGFENNLAKKNGELKKPYTVSASLGHITTVPTAADTLEELIGKADEKMYLVKKKTR